MLPTELPWELTFGGRGNNGPLSFFLRGKRKNVVVVETVCVVVVVAKTPWSPELPSDLEDSDIRDSGNARAEFVSSPYAGGAGGTDCDARGLFDPSRVAREVRVAMSSSAAPSCMEALDFFFPTTLFLRGRRNTDFRL